MSQTYAASLMGVNPGVRSAGLIPLTITLTSDTYATAVGGVAIKICPSIAAAFPGANPANLPPFFHGRTVDGYSCDFKVRTKWTVADTELTSIVVASTGIATATTVFAHGLSVGDVVRVSGATVDTDLNSASGSSYTILSVATSTTFTFLTTSVTAATYNESTLIVSLPATAATPAAITVRLFNGTTEISDAAITKTITSLVPVG